MSQSQTSRQTIHPQNIAQFFSLDQCPAYLVHEYANEVSRDPNIDDVPQSPLLEVTGNEHESDQIAALLAARVNVVGPTDNDFSNSFDETWSGSSYHDIEQAQNHIAEIAGDKNANPYLFLEFPIKERIKAWPVEGSIDVVLSVPTEWGIEVRIIEIKSGPERAIHHKRQAATYTLALKESLSDVPDVSITASVTSNEVSLASVVTAKGGIDLEELPQLHLDPLESDIELLLERNGPFDKIILGASELPPHQLNGACDGCPHQARCLGYDIAVKDLSLLQLPESAQITFEEHGVTDITDVADLYKIPTNRGARSPINYTDLEPTKPELVESLQEKTNMGDLTELAQIAHRFQRELVPEYNTQWKDKANAGPWPSWLIGSGTNLPDDNPNDENWSNKWDKYPKKSLVRVYFTVIPDYVRNRVGYIGALVTCSRYVENDNNHEFVTTRPKALPIDDEAKEREERRLLESFFKELEAAVARVAPDIATEDNKCGAKDGYLHLYCWSENQRDVLVDAVKRHPDAYGSQALRKLLGLRKEIDQEALSVMTSEFRDRHALRYPGLGLVQTVPQFYRSDGDFDWSDHWSDKNYDIREAFDTRFLATAIRVNNVAGKTLVPEFDKDYESLDKSSRPKKYPVLERHRDTLPIEYVWAAEEFDKLQPEDADDEETKRRINDYRYYDGCESPRITLADIDEAVEAICAAIHHVERSIGYKNAFLPKKPLKVHALSEEEFGETALQRACAEYQHLDHGASKEGRLKQYRRPLQQRVIDGEAVVFKCSRTPQDKENTIPGDVIWDIGHSDGRVGSAPLSFSPSDWVVVTPLEQKNGRLVEKPENPEDYANSMLAVINHVNKDTISLFSMWDEGDWPSSNSPSMTWHFGWKNNESAAQNADQFASQKGRDYDTTLIERDEYFVVDKAVDDYSAYRAHKALTHAQKNPVHNQLIGIYEDENPTALQGLDYAAEDTEYFIELFDDVHPEHMNTKQREFVGEIDHSITALQGPPGTGKTSMAAAPAILARVHAHGSGFTGLCSAHSNTAVNEILEDVADSLRLLNQQGSMEDLKLVRVRASSTNHEVPQNVEDIHYRNDENRLMELYSRTISTDAKILLFGTPVTVRNTLNRVVTRQFDEYENIERMMDDGKTGVFDSILIDEASMMDLPVLFLAGAFLDEAGQLMLIGDHRQMQPIQHHDFEEEDRKPIEDHTPSVSAIDFIRFLRGDSGFDLDYLERDPPEWRDPDVVLPMTRLEVTYRLPQQVADLATELFYHQDNIRLESGVRNDTIPDVRKSVDDNIIKAALDPEARLTLIVHDESQARNESPLEARLTRSIVDAVPTAKAGESGSTNRISAGVVVPFRLQRRRLRRLLSRDVQVDTVEKFQGGERDLIVLSMVSGSQGYINTLTDFMLDPNRFNVGASRMRQKLVIIASKALFRAGSSDAGDYSEQKSWKLLYNKVARGQTPDAATTLDRTDISELEGQNVNVEVYTHYVVDDTSSGN